MTEKPQDINEIPSQEANTFTNEERETYICENINWNGGKELLNEYLDLTTRHVNYRGEKKTQYDSWGSLALEMYKFDPKRFQEEVEVTDFMWKEFSEDINDKIRDLYSPGSSQTYEYYTRFDIFDLSELIALLKELDYERFTQSINMEHGHWNNIPRWVEEERDCIVHFLLRYNQALAIDEQKAREQVSINKYDWEKIIKEANEERQRGGPYLWVFAVIGQKIKPEGLPDITVSQEEWDNQMEELKNWVTDGWCDEKVFAFANILKNKEVKIKN